MYPHHQRTIARLVQTFESDPRFLALLIGGSIAKGFASEASDVDIMLVATEEEFQKRTTTDDLLYFTRDFCDYPDGYVDGKVIDIAFMREVAEIGSETARSAFVGVTVAFCHDPVIPELIAQITAYPEHQREEKMKAFYSQVLLLNWFVSEAEKRSDLYLMSFAVSSLALYSARLILAYNRILFPFHKWLMKTVANAPEKPAEYSQLVDTLLKTPNVENAQRLSDCMTRFHDWGVSFPEAVVRFMKDTEWNWRSGFPPLSDA
jgi:hypothetical protein